MRRKPTVSFFQATNKRNLTQETLNMATKGKTLEEKQNLF